MLKRQETVLSSSSRRETVPENHHAKTIGCLAGILQLVSKYQNRHRNRITFGRKHGKNNEEVRSSASKSAKPSVPVENQAPLPALMTITMRCDQNKKKGGEKICEVRRRFSCEVPRSPTLPPEIRRSNSVNSPENFRTTTPPSPALVARLMGLEEIPAAESTIAEKRKKLLGALEKCDEDLKAIKKIIEALSCEEPERLPSPPPPTVVNRLSAEGNASLRGVRKCMGSRNDEDQYDVSGEASDGGGGGDIMRNVKFSTEFDGGEQRSPISVFDDFTRSPLNSNRFLKRHINNGRRMVQQQQQKPQLMMTNPRVVRRDADDFGFKWESVVAASQYSCNNKATMNMIESVDEACRDIAWGEKREVGRIGLVLQDYICRDLIDEFVKEYLGDYCTTTSTCMLYYSLPLQACKRRLPF